MNAPEALHAYQAAGAIGRDDIAAATMLAEMAKRDHAAEPSLLAWLGMCLALRTVRDGHTCVDLDRITDWAGDIVPSLHGNLSWPMDAGSWMDALQEAGALVGVPGGSRRTPFVLDGHRLYLARSLSEEQAIADALSTRATAKTIHILLGGPGTGKTTTVAENLVARFNDIKPGQPVPRIALAAPTGKAAARMTEAVKHACASVDGSAELASWIAASPARTIHKLLDFNPNRSKRFAYNAKTPLPYDIVIVDEASMISSSLMARLLAAVPPDAELRLVGDPDQLASVDAGTVLGDLATFGDREHTAHPLHSCITTLETVYRQESENILGLGKAIRKGDVDATFSILEAGGSDVVLVDPSDTAGLDAATVAVVEHAKNLRKAARAGDSDAILEARSALQVLCAHREGSMGVSGWNARIEKRLGVRVTDPWYAGRPVMVTRNTPSLRLSNGDVGVVVEDGSRREAVFGVPRQSFRVPVSRLEDIETVHAFTIHKSQGSEYGHVVVVLPEQPSRIVTRELLYTGITRARTKVTVVAPRAVIAAAIKTPIRRATGLADRLA
jgi:exodeoxyribonuclease V alpha subunit